MAASPPFAAKRAESIMFWFGRGAVIEDDRSAGGRRENGRVKQQSQGDEERVERREREKQKILGFVFC